MYRKLSSTIVFFVTLFGALTVVVLLARVGCVHRDAWGVRFRRDLSNKVEGSIYHDITIHVQHTPNPPKPTPQPHPVAVEPPLGRDRLLGGPQLRRPRRRLLDLAPLPDQQVFGTGAWVLGVCVTNRCVGACVRVADVPVLGGASAPLQNQTQSLNHPHAQNDNQQQAKQLPTSEAGVHGEEGIEFSISSQFSIADDEDLDDDDEGYDHPGVGGRGAVAALR